MKQDKLLSTNTIIAFLVVIGVFNIVSTVPQIKHAGKGALVLVILLTSGVLLFKKPEILKQSILMQRFAIIFGLFILVNVFSLITHEPNFYGLYILMQIIATAVIFLYTIESVWNTKHLFILVIMAHGIILLALWFYSQHDYQMRQQALGNLLFGIGYAPLALSRIHQNYKIRLYCAVFALALGPLFFKLGARAALIGYIITIIVYIIWPVAVRSLIPYVSIIIIVLVSIIIFTFQYPQLQKDRDFKKVNDTVFESTGEQFFSGREIIWRRAMCRIEDRPLWGYGI